MRQRTIRKASAKHREQCSMVAEDDGTISPMQTWEWQQNKIFNSEKKRKRHILFTMLLNHWMVVYGIWILLCPHSFIPVWKQPPPPPPRFIVIVRAVKSMMCTFSNTPYPSKPVLQVSTHVRIESTSKSFTWDRLTTHMVVILTMTFSIYCHNSTVII